MLRLRSCFNDGGGKRDLHEGGGREEGRESNSLVLGKGTERKESESRDICDKMAMDLQPSAPFASSSSFPSPHVMESPQTFEEIQFAYQKLQNMHSESLSGTASPPPPPPGLASRVSLWNTIHNGDAPSVRPWSSCGTMTLSGSGYDRPRSVGTYFSPNKIAHRGGTLSTVPNSASHQDGPCLTSLQELLQKTTNAKKVSSKPHEPNRQTVDPSSGRLLNKLRNLDEILRSLDDSLLSRKFTSLNNKMATPQLEDTQTPSNVANLLDRGQFPTSFAPIVDQTKDMAPIIAPKLGTMSQVGTRHATTLERQLAESDANWLGGDSVGTIHDPQFFSTPLATRIVKQDIPLLLSRYSSAKNSTPSSTHSQESPMKEVLSRVDFLEQQIAQSMECLRGKLQQRPKRCITRKRTLGKKVVVILQKQLFSSFQQRLTRTDAALRAVKRQLKNLLHQHHHHQHTFQAALIARNVNAGEAAAEALDFNQSKIQISQDDGTLPQETEGAASETIKDSASLRRTVKTLEEKYAALSAVTQQLAQGAEEVKKQCSEHSLEIERDGSSAGLLSISSALTTSSSETSFDSTKAQMGDGNRQTQD